MEMANSVARRKYSRDCVSAEEKHAINQKKKGKMKDDFYMLS